MHLMLSSPQVFVLGRKMNQGLCSKSRPKDHREKGIWHPVMEDGSESHGGWSASVADSVVESAVC